jgi:hypothetical protein
MIEMLIPVTFRSHNYGVVYPKDIAAVGGGYDAGLAPLRTTHEVGKIITGNVSLGLVPRAG